MLKPTHFYVTMLAAFVAVVNKEMSAKFGGVTIASETPTLNCKVASELGICVALDFK